MSEQGNTEAVAIPLKDAAKKLSVCERTLRRRMAEEKIPEINLGPRKRSILVADLAELLAARTREVSIV